MIEKLCTKMMISGGIISYPFFIMAGLSSKHHSGHILDYPAICFFAIIPSTMVGVTTPIVLFGSPIWIPLYFIDKKIFNRKE